MKFVIRPQEAVQEAYRARFDSLDEAIAYAEKLSTERRTSVDVLQLIGTFAFTTQWVPSSERPKPGKK